MLRLTVFLLAAISARSAFGYKECEWRILYISFSSLLLCYYIYLYPSTFIPRIISRLDATTDTLNRLCSTNHLKIMFEFITDNKPEVQLHWDNDSAAIVGQHWNASTMHKLPVCHFRVDARKYALGTDRGIYASVRQMKLRRSGAGGSCIDFVSFKRENSVSSGRLCGDYAASDDYSGDESKFFADDGGLLYVHVELDTSRKLLPTEELYVEIVLTAYEKSE